MLKRPYRLVMLLAAVLAYGASVPASAERIASKPEAPSASRAADVARVSDAIARDDVRQALAAHGLRPSEVEARLARLSDEDLRRLAANLDQVQAAGSVPNYIWVLLGIFLAVSIIVMIV
jgi:cytochrome c553